ncbi:hypothetical protein HYQ45_002695 [Verticillium longisporum]|uniref:Uncharacterized protein n=1 Tax=Verticillium longisporum TaxID=100787 RepID=A0A8I3AVK8_VERLO|nr:hypothetical protein HYQ45_002695 [Verticillium longisporum]
MDKHHVLGLGDLNTFARARAFRLQVTFLEDGLLLLAAETCGVSGSLSPPMTPFQPATLAASIAPDISWHDLVTSCPELGLFPENTPFGSVATPLPRLDPLPPPPGLIRAPYS